MPAADARARQAQGPQEAQEARRGRLVVARIAAGGSRVATGTARFPTPGAAAVEMIAARTGIVLGAAAARRLAFVRRAAAAGPFDRAVAGRRFARRRRALLLATAVLARLGPSGFERDR